MSSTDDYTTKIEVIKAIADDQVETPGSIPVGVYVQEAEDLYYWCQPDRDVLVAKGLSWELVEDLPSRCGALGVAQAKWKRERFSREEAEILWSANSPLAYALRDDLVQQFRFAFRGSASLLGRVAEIADGTGHADMIQDLRDLYELGTANTELLLAIDFDVTLLDRAAQTADEMSELLAQATRDRSDDSEVKRIRDQAYTYVKMVVDEICKYGQFVFRKNLARRKGYSSSYLRKKRAQLAAKKAVPLPVPGVTAGSLVEPVTVSAVKKVAA